MIWLWLLVGPRPPIKVLRCNDGEDTDGWNGLGFDIITSASAIGTGTFPNPTTTTTTTTTTMPTGRWYRREVNTNRVSYTMKKLVRDEVMKMKSI
jgi:hypothetical protein